jgi:hypothetical protein
MGRFLKNVDEIFIINIQLEIKSGNSPKLSEKGETSGKHRAKGADLAEFSEFSAFNYN